LLNPTSALFFAFTFAFILIFNLNNSTGNRIDAEGAKALAEALKKNKTLTKLNLEGE
jgi:hypothetical protein